MNKIYKEFNDYDWLREMHISRMKNLEIFWLLLKTL
jgi:hypothetical protein